MAERQKGENSAEDTQIINTSKGATDMRGNMDYGRKDTEAPAFVKLLQDADVFENCESWKVRYRAKAEDVFMPLSTSKLYDGSAMIPIFCGGAIQTYFVRPCPASVVIR